MPAPSHKAVLVTLFLVGVAVSSGVVFLDDVLADSWSENGVVVRPTDDPNGEYATVGSDGTVTVALDEPGINPQSLTIVRRVFVASNEGANWTRVWLTHDQPTRLSVVDERTGEPLLGAANSTVLAPGDRLVATLRVDTRATDAVPADVLLHELTVHTEPVASPQSKRTPTTVTITTTMDAASTSRESLTVDFGPGIGDVNVSVDTLSVTELERRTEPSATGPIPIIDAPSGSTPRKIDSGSPVSDSRGVHVNGTAVDLVVPARTVVTLDGTRSVVPTVTAVDSRHRIAAAVDVQVPASLHDHPAVLRFAIPRERFGDAPPAVARIGHLTPTGWELLDTRVVDNTDSSVVLEARTPGFSRFVVFAEPAVTYRWGLPGGRTEDGARTETVFQDPGLHQVSLVVSTDQGATAARDAVVLANDRPRIEIDRPANISPGSPVTLDAAVSNEYGNTSVTWVLPDGRIVPGRSVEHTFRPGTHTVTVHAADSYGANTTVTETVTVSASPRGTNRGDGTPVIRVPGLGPMESDRLLDLALLLAALLGGVFLLVIVCLLVLFGMGLLRVGDREDDALIAAFRGHATLGSGLEDDGYDSEQAIAGLFDDGDVGSLGALLDREWESTPSLFDSHTDRTLLGVGDGLDAATKLLPTRRNRVFGFVAQLFRGRSVAIDPWAGWSRQRSSVFSLPKLRRTRGPEVTAFHDPAWDPRRNRFVIGRLAVAHPDRALATVEITIVDDSGEPLARKTVDLSGRGVYRASPELVPGVPEAAVGGTSGYAVQVRVVDSRSNETTVRQRVRVPRRVSAT